MGKEQQHDNLSRETEILEKPGSEAQIRIAKALVDILGRDRPLTRDDFRKIDQPLNLASHAVEDDSEFTQENLARIWHENLTWGAMKRFVNVLALVAAEGNEDRAKDLLGGSDSYEEQPELTDRIREITKPEKARTKPQTSDQARALYQRWKEQHERTPTESGAQSSTSQAKALFQRWKEQGRPTTVNPPPKRD